MLRGEPVDHQSGVVGRLGRKLVSMARQAGAQCIVVACPLCQLNLDLRQADAPPRRTATTIPATPVLYITQLLGLALGIPAKELGLDALSISADSLLAEIGPPCRGQRGGAMTQAIISVGPASLRRCRPTVIDNTEYGGPASLRDLVPLR